MALSTVPTNVINLLKKYKITPNTGMRSKVSVKLRLWIYSLVFLHSVPVATYLLTIDFSQSEDPIVKKYNHFKWKLITAWFNLVFISYIPVCIYCDWKELTGTAKSSLNKFLNQFRFVCFTSILLPVTIFSDLLFWRLWYTHRDYLMPRNIENYIPFWTQHSMHTLSFALVIFDLMLVPRRRPRSIIPGFAVMCIFMTLYILMVIHSVLNGEYIYPLLELLNNFDRAVLVLYTFTEISTYYTLQWIIIELVWGKMKNKKML